MSIDKKDNLEMWVGIMQGSIDAIQLSLAEIKKAISDLRVDITSNYVTNNQLQLELKNVRDSFEPVKQTVNSVVSQILKYTVGAMVGAGGILLAMKDSI